MSRDSQRRATHKLRKSTTISPIAKGTSNGKAAYDNSTHHLLSLKRVPDSLVELQKELLLPPHRDIYLAASQGTTFEECIGTIAAKLDIVLDGEYEPDALFSLLVTALRSRKAAGNNPSSMHPELVAVELIERAGEVKMDFAGAYFDPSLLPTPANDGFSIWMKEQGCEVCEGKEACIAAEKCLGSKEALEEAGKMKEVEG
jgi:hypothetical protein